MYQLWYVTQQDQQDKPHVLILCVDDEEELLNLAQIFLERMDACTVTKATSASEALALLASSRFDVIVSDYMMPVTDGIEFLRQVRPLYPDIPFILFTGKGREEVAIQAIDNGAAFYIQKGGDPTAQFTELMHKIRQAVARARAEAALMKNFVTLQKQEKIIKEREKYYRAVFENTGTAMMVINEDTIISLCNAECERMSGYTRQEVEGKKSWTEFVAEEDRKQMLAWHRLRRENGSSAPINYEFTLLTRSGERRRISLTIDLIPGTKKSIVSLIDVTDRIRAEEALKRSEILHRTIFEISPDPIAMTDVNGNLVRTSPSALRLFGLESDEEAIGRSLFDWIVPEMRDEVRDRVLRYIRLAPAAKSATLFPLIRKGGERFFAEISSSVLTDDTGRPIGMVSILRDVTDRINTDHALKKANEKLNLLSTVTRHDILNTITILLCYIELALDENNPEVMKNFLGKIRTAAGTLGAQVQFTRDYQNLGINLPCWQNVSRIITAASSGLDCGQVRIHDRTGSLEVFADPLFAKAIYNLIDNSLRHGMILTGITIRHEKADPDLLLIVEDDGTGIPEDDKEKVFSKGYGKNTGLGLFLVREILAITDMTIAETSTPGSGAQFTIRIKAGNFRFPDAA